MEANEKREILADSPLFDNLLPIELSALSELFRVLDFQTDDVVFKQGEVGDSVYVIATGKIQVVRNNPSGEEKTLATLEAPQFFGEMSLIDKEYRSATVKAAATTRLLQLTNENLHVFARNYRNGFTWVVVNIAKVLSARLRTVNDKLSEKL